MTSRRPGPGQRPAGRVPGDIRTSGQFPKCDAVAADERGQLVLFQEPACSIAMGSVAERVVFVCFVGETSLTLAKRCTRRLRRLLGDSTGVALFMDAQAVEGGNVEARSEIIQSIVALRGQLSALVVLVRAPTVELSARVLGSAFGKGAFVTSDAGEFDRLLTDAAPFAYELVSPGNCVTAGPPTLPPVKIVRSA